MEKLIIEQTMKNGVITRTGYLQLNRDKTLKEITEWSKKENTPVIITNGIPYAQLYIVTVPLGLDVYSTE